MTSIKREKDKAQETIARKARVVNIPEGAAWEGLSISSPICCDIPGLGFRSFPDKDSAVNYCYQLGHKVLARAINASF